MVCVRKRDGSMRLCVDYRKLNKKIQANCLPIPRVQDILHNLGGQKCFTSLDMSKAYHLRFIDKYSRHFTVFTSPWAYTNG